MADLRIPDVDGDLQARLKAGAAMAKMTLKAFIVELLTKALKERETAAP